MTKYRGMTWKYQVKLGEPSYSDSKWCLAPPRPPPRPALHEHNFPPPAPQASLGLRSTLLNESRRDCSVGERAAGGVRNTLAFWGVSVVCVGCARAGQAPHSHGETGGGHTVTGAQKISESRRRVGLECRQQGTRSIRPRQEVYGRGPVLGFAANSAGRRSASAVCSAAFACVRRVRVRCCPRMHKAWLHLGRGFTWWRQHCCRLG
jgi:hypothetical protein